MASCCFFRQTHVCSHSCLGHCSDVDHYAVSWDNVHFPESASSDKMAWFRLRCKGAWQCCHVHLMRWLVCQTDKTKGLERLEGSLALISLRASRRRKFRFPDQSWTKGLRKKVIYVNSNIFFISMFGHNVSLFLRYFKQYIYIYIYI